MDKREYQWQRDRQARRTASARRGVVTTGAIGAVGAAVAIGLTTHSATTSSPDDSGTYPQDSRGAPSLGQDQDENRSQDDGGFTRQVPAPQPPPGNGGQLAAPGGGAPTHARSGGS